MTSTPVWLVEGHVGRKSDSMVLACHRKVYCDMLQSTIEQTYDPAIVEHNRGFIPSWLTMSEGDVAPPPQGQPRVWGDSSPGTSARHRLLLVLSGKNRDAILS
jgi:hypothetical protein